MSKSRKAFQSRQQIKDEQINYLLGDVEKKLEEYKNVLELKEKQLLDAKKILLLTKHSYNKTVAENRDLKTYIENLKQRFQSMQQQQQVQFLKKNREKLLPTKKPTPKNYKKVVYEEESGNEPELEQEEDEEIEEEEVEKEPEIKKGRAKKMRNFLK